MRLTALRSLLTLATLAALGPPARGEDAWMSDFAIDPFDDIVSQAAYYEPAPQQADATGIDLGPTELPPFEPPAQLDAAAAPASQSYLAADPLYDSAAGEVCCGEGCAEPKRRRNYSHVELIAMRAHFSEVPIGKIAEKYELSERLLVGTENSHGTGGRIRYWSYDRTTPSLQPGGDSIRFDFDVVDFEGTTKLSFPRVDVVIAGGLRWADIKIDLDSGRSRNDMPGGSFGIDLRGLMCCDQQHSLEWHSIGGARWSIFGGDWEGGQNGLIQPERDDNITVLEIYGGFELSRRRNGREYYARLLFESQNWRSDALARSAGTDSLGFIGPGVTLGVNF